MALLFFTTGGDRPDLDLAESAALPHVYSKDARAIIW
jgi:hypothetical protein